MSRRGRPPKGDDKRTERVELRLSPAEAAAVEAGAAAAEMRVADFVRRGALGLAAAYVETGAPRVALVGE